MTRSKLATPLAILLALPLATLGCADKDDGGGDGGGTDSVGDGDGDGGDGDGDGASGDGGGDGDGDGDGVPDFGPARGDLTISGIEISQSIAQTVWNGSASVPPNERAVQTVRNRFTIVRALWAPPSGWTPRPMLARLHLRLPDGTEQVYTDYLTQTGSPPTISGPSSVAQISESFFWRIDPELVEPGLQYYVTVWEATEADSIPASAGGNTYPPEGYTDLGVAPLPSELKVALVGVRYNAGGCVSDTSDITPDGPRADEYNALRDGFEAWNAVETDGVTLDTNLSVDINYNVNSVQELLSVVGQLRGQYATSLPEAFFYIAWDDCAPSPGGVLGIAPLGSENPTIQGASQRYSAGLWNPRQNGAFIQESINTAVHEVGHNQGAPHAPCGIPGQTDPAYPHAGASIGVRGLDPTNARTYLPGDHTDFMSYCRPYWVSDYRWRKSFSHQTTMTGWSSGDIQAPEAHEVLALEPELGSYAGAVLVGLVTPDGEGDMWWINTREQPPANMSMASDVAVELVTDTGTVALPTYSTPLSDLPGAFLVEMPLYDTIDPDQIRSVHVAGNLMDFKAPSPEIRDMRDLQFTVRGELFGDKTLSR